MPVSQGLQNGCLASLANIPASQSSQPSACDSEDVPTAQSWQAVDLVWSAKRPASHLLHAAAGLSAYVPFSQSTQPVPVSVETAPASQLSQASFSLAANVPGPHSLHSARLYRYWPAAHAAHPDAFVSALGISPAGHSEQDVDECEAPSAGWYKPNGQLRQSAECTYWPAPHDVDDVDDVDDSDDPDDPPQDFASGESPLGQDLQSCSVWPHSSMYQ